MHIGSGTAAPVPTTIPALPPLLLFTLFERIKLSLLPTKETVPARAIVAAHAMAAINPTMEICRIRAAACRVRLGIAPALQDTNWGYER